MTSKLCLPIRAPAIYQVISINIFNNSGEERKNENLFVCLETINDINLYVLEKNWHNLDLIYLWHTVTIMAQKSTLTSQGFLISLGIKRLGEWGNISNPFCLSRYLVLPTKSTLNLLVLLKLSSFWADIPYKIWLNGIEMSNCNFN